MPIDPSAVGITGEPRKNSWNSKDALLYAVGVGAGTHTHRVWDTTEIGEPLFEFGNRFTQGEVSALHQAADIIQVGFDVGELTL